MKKNPEWWKNTLCVISVPVVFTSNRSCADRHSAYYWQGLNRNKLLKQWQDMPESVAGYHLIGWQGLLRNI